MMTMNTFLYLAEKALDRYLPQLLTGAGIALMGTSAVLSAVETPEALRRLEEKKPETTWEKVKTVAPVYIPSAISFALGATSSVMGMEEQMSRTAAIATGFALLEKDFAEYKDISKQVIGEEKAAEVENQVAAKNVATAVKKEELPEGGGPEGLELFQDCQTKQLFWSTMSRVKSAVNEINHDINHFRARSLPDFFELIADGRRTMYNNIPNAPECPDGMSTFGWDAEHDLLRLRPYGVYISELGRSVTYLEYKAHVDCGACI